MMKALRLEKNQIKEAVKFALDNADSVGEIIEILANALTTMDLPLLTKLTGSHIREKAYRTRVTV
ncbi:hypothetical protein SETIT_9G478900v2 [Setaria italica]|uniref:Uncharacterized protein n=1 Tax=Setaria italica TaxID=4555 RepID=A0A368STK2_SETIT|nr:hypothetical protein SETIT_9G478900v2 [Setaria italica]